MTGQPNIPDPSLTYLRDELLQLGVMLNEKCAPWLLGLRLKNIAESFNRSISTVRGEREGAADEALLDRYADRPDGDGLPTGIKATEIVAEYIRVRAGDVDEDDAANIIHILHEAGVRFARPTRDGAEVAGEHATICHACGETVGSNESCDLPECPRKSTAPPNPAPSLEPNSVADSTGSQPGTHGASKEAGGHSRGGLTPVSTLSEKHAPDAVRKGDRDDV